MSPQLHQSGFTLLELLVALTVFGFMMIGLNQGSRAGFAAWTVQTREVSARDQLDTTDRVLRRLIGELEPPSGVTSGTIIGSRDQFRFTTLLPTSAALDTRRIDATLLLEGTKLVLRWAPHRHEIRQRPAPAETENELISGVRSLSIRYWHADGDGGEWRDSWSELAPPHLVKIHLEFPKGDFRHWPDIVVGPAREEA